MNKVIFFQIKNQLEKFSKITKTAFYHFENEKKLLFITPDSKIQNYVDDVLWKDPKYSFLPHTQSNVPIDELIVITSLNSNINNSSYLFNLTQKPLLAFENATIYEFEDLLDKKKAVISKDKFNVYKEQNFAIEFSNIEY